MIPCHLIGLLDNIDYLNKQVKLKEYCFSRTFFYHLKSLSIFYVIKELKKCNYYGISYRVVRKERITMDNGNEQLAYLIEIVCGEKKYLFHQIIKDELYCNCTYNLIKNEVDSIIDVTDYKPIDEKVEFSKTECIKRLNEIIIYHHNDNWRCLSDFNFDDWWRTIHSIYWNTLISNPLMCFKYSTVHIRYPNKKCHVTLTELRECFYDYKDMLIACYADYIDGIKPMTNQRFYQKLKCPNYLQDGKGFICVNS